MSARRKSAVALDTAAVLKLVEARGSRVYADSALVARKFGMKHNQLVRIIETVLADFPELRGSRRTPNDPAEEHFCTEERAYRGQPYTAYLMNRPFFTLVGMRCETRAARDWQRAFNRGFYALEQETRRRLENHDDPAWVIQRDAGKAARALLADGLDRFVAYATAQGSSGAKYYFKHVTDAAYKALGLVQHKVPSLRDTLNSVDLSMLMVLEIYARHRLAHYMDLGLHYKAIFAAVAVDLKTYAVPLIPARADLLRLAASKGKEPAGKPDDADETATP